MGHADDKADQRVWVVRCGPPENMRCARRAGGTMGVLGAACRWQDQSKPALSEAKLATTYERVIIVSKVDELLE